MDNHLFYQFQNFRHQLNKLQAHKSSFQAWKCVSFGYALLATVLLTAKWHEVSTDLKLLHSIDHLLWQAPGNLSEPLGDHHLTSGDNKSHTEARWGPAVVLAELMMASSQDFNHTNNGSAVLMSHVQASLGREMNGNHLLKQEVETFLAEFRSAKSTLGLSSMLVLVYIVSWVLMTMAVNDARISNDISMRNILLLSVFGAIDMAASIGFVMVRLIMYNVKSNTVMPEILSPATLRDASARLSSDQLTAFTALRLIAMRSCSAYIDVYVSVLVALLTLLRFYSILRAIAYYRFLRRFNDLNRNIHHQQQLTAAYLTNEKQPFPSNHQRATTLHGFISQTGPGADLMRAPWQMLHAHQQDANGPTTASTNLTILASPGNQQMKRLSVASQEKPPQSLSLAPSRQATLSRRPAPDSQPNYSDHQEQIALNEEITLNNEAYFNDQLIRAQNYQLSDKAQASDLQKEAEDQQVASKSLVRQASSESRQQFQTVRSRVPEQRPSVFVVAEDLRNSLRHDDQAGWTEKPTAQANDAPKTNTEFRAASILTAQAPSVLMVDGRPHKLITATRSEFIRHKHLFTGSESLAGFESEPVGPEVGSRHRHRVRQIENKERFVLDANGNRVDSLGKQQQQHFTLLSASQLDRLSRRLLANASAAHDEGHRTLTAGATGRPRRQPDGDHPSSELGGRYKLLARYRPLKRASDLDERQVPLPGSAHSASRDREATRAASRSKRHSRAYSLAAPRPALAASLADSTSETSSASSTASDSDEAYTTRVTTTPEAASNPRQESYAARARRERAARLFRAETSNAAARSTSGRRKRTRASLGSLRHTDEPSLEPSAAAKPNRDLLLEKYYYA